MKLLKTLCLFVVSAFVLFTGCVSTDLSGCPPDNNLTLSFYYLNFPDRINRVTVGIYDANNLLMYTKEVEKSDLDAFQGISLNLPIGSYTAVCWGNAFANTQIRGITYGDNLYAHEVAHPGYFTSSTISTNDALYYGIHTFAITDNKQRNETIPFTPAHIRLVIQTKGLASTAQGAPIADYPYIKVNKLVPAYDYQMTSFGSPTTYYPTIQVEPKNNQTESICDVLRFQAINPITIDVMENKTTNNIIHTVDLQSFIAANNIEITAGKEVVIPILISFDQGGVNVTVTFIENWGNEPVDPFPQE